jgi:hypothetical protein
VFPDDAFVASLVNYNSNPFMGLRFAMKFVAKCFYGNPVAHACPGMRARAINGTEEEGLIRYIAFPGLSSAAEVVQEKGAGQCSIIAPLKTDVKIVFGQDGLRITTLDC